MGAALRDLVQHRAPPQRHQVRDPGATPLRAGGVVAAGASTGLRGRQAGHAPALERTSDTRLATRRRGLAQPRKGEHSRTAKFRACSLKKTDIFFDKHRIRNSCICSEAEQGKNLADEVLNTISRRRSKGIDAAIDETKSIVKMLDSEQGFLNYGLDRLAVEQVAYIFFISCKYKSNARAREVSDLVIRTLEDCCSQNEKSRIKNII